MTTVDDHLVACGVGVFGDRCRLTSRHSGRHRGARYTWNPIDGDSGFFGVFVLIRQDQELLKALDVQQIGKGERPA